MSDIPPEVSWEILLRLPAKSLFCCRSVSKAWLRIIDNPIFVKAHSMNHAYSHTLLMRNATGAPLYSFSLDSLNFIKGPQMIEATLSKQFQRRGSPLMPDLFQVASCNSLLLICNWDNQRIWAIWNPITKESRGLPKPDELGHLRGFGFAYDHHTDDYKVVRIEDMRNDERVYRTLVYSLKSDSWKMIENCPCERPWKDRGAFFEGKLYWTSGSGLIALDLKTETYSQLPPPCDAKFPPPSDAIRGRERVDFYVDALDGCLIYTRRYEIHLSGWVMKDDGAESLWIKLFSLSYSAFDVNETFRLVAYFKSKMQVLVHYGCGFMWLDIESDSKKEIIPDHGLHRFWSSQICPGSLVRLNCGESTVGLRDVASTTSTKKRKRTRKRKATKVRLLIRDFKEEQSEDKCYCGEKTCWCGGLCETCSPFDLDQCHDFIDLEQWHGLDQWHDL